MWMLGRFGFSPGAQISLDFSGLLLVHLSSGLVTKTFLAMLKITVLPLQDIPVIASQRWQHVLAFDQLLQPFDKLWYGVQA